MRNYSIIIIIKKWPFFVTLFLKLLCTTQKLPFLKTHTNKIKKILKITHTRMINEMSQFNQ